MIIGECCEVTGETFWGIDTAEPVPESATMLFLNSDLIGLAEFRRKPKK